MLPAQHHALGRYNHTRLDPGLPNDAWRDDIAREASFLLQEGAFVEEERAKVKSLAAEAPLSSTEFTAWFEALEHNGPGQHDPLFPWLATEARLDQLKWFLRQEVGGEAGFEDLVAMTQLKLGVRAKMELAKNYWDEMGRGTPTGMHGPMLARLASGMRLDEGATEPVVWESVALGNLMIALAANRRYAYHSIGALGVIELTAPGRAKLVNEALRRHEVAPQLRQYFALHSTLDLKHSASWNQEVIAPLVAREPMAARAIAEGALMRLEAGRRCYARYRQVLGVDAVVAQPQVHRLFASAGA